MHYAGIVLDIYKAFDTIQLSLLAHILEHRGVSHAIATYLIGQCLQARQTVVFANVIMLHQ